MKRKGGAVLWIIFMAVGIIFASGAIAVYVVFLKPENISRVPSLIGKPLVEAAAESEKLGLVIQVEPVASTMPDNRVLAQSPEAGTELRQGQVIVLQVSRSGELHAVPDVRGQTLAEAQASIKEQGFSLGDVIKIREPGIEAGNVIAQSPAPPADISAGRKIDLLVQDGAASDGTVKVPDVNRMTESEARNVIETSGLKVQAVDKVYSPLLPEGLAIETRPTAGSTMRVGQGVILKLATQRRPAGFMDGKDTANVRKVTSNQNQNQNQAKTQTSTQTPAKTQTQTPAPSRNVTVSVKGEEDVFIGDDYDGSSTRTASTTPAKSQPASRTSSTQTQTQSQTQTPAAQPSGGSKTARIRYQVPPIAQPMNLRIEVTDPSGKRDILNRQVRSGESITASASYTQECVVSFYLGGQSVWQERYR